MQVCGKIYKGQKILLLMKINLVQKPKGAVIIEGFPGYGLVGTITTDFLIKHLKAKPIGSIRSNKLLPMVAVHNSEVVEPVGIYYDEKSNIVIIHVLSGVHGLEWELSKKILKLAKIINAKEIISIEGVGSAEKVTKGFYYTKDEKRKSQFERIGLEPLKEGLIMGVTGALLLRSNASISCIFVGSHIDIADNKASAKMIEILDSYLGLNVDYKPLLKQAKEFEDKLRATMFKGKEASLQNYQDKKPEVSYLG